MTDRFFNHRRAVLPVFTISCLLWFGIALSAGEPLAGRTIALPISPREPDPTPTLVLMTGLGLHLRERLDEAPGWNRVSDARVDSIHRALSPDTIDPARIDFAAELRRFQPVDVLLDFQPGDETRLTLLADQGGARSEVSVEFPRRADFQERLWMALEAIAGLLELSDADRALLLEDRWPGNAADLEVYYRARAISTPNSSFEIGDIRLSVLFERWEANRENPRFAAEVLVNALSQARSRANYDYRRVDWIWMTETFFEAVLGTPEEPVLYPLIEEQPTLFAERLLELSRPLTIAGGDILDDLGLFDSGSSRGDSFGTGSPSSSRDTRLPEIEPGPRTVTMEKRLGAMRSLGYLDEASIIDLLRESMRHPEAGVREAAAFALGRKPGASRLELLQTLSNDKDPSVAWTAGHALWRFGEEVPGLLPRARDLLRGPSSHHEPEAIQVLAELATAEDLPLLESLNQRPLDPGTQGALIQGRQRIGVVPAEEIPGWLRRPGTDLLTAALAVAAHHLSDPAVVSEVGRLANDPNGSLARTARTTLLPLRPVNPSVEQARHDIAYEDPYLRFRAIEWLADQGSLEALEALRKACGNPDPHLRTEALKHLARVAPELARSLVFTALTDPHRWVAFHAAVLAADFADSSFTQALQERLERVEEPAERLYLKRAMAAAEGGEQPDAPLPTARSIAGENNLAWNTSPSSQAATSPFDAYYSMKVRADDHMRAAYEAGKIIFGRATPIGSPGLIMVNPASRDSFWINLENQITLDDLAVLDGFIYGEETMNVNPARLWEDGWRSFCLEAGIPLERIDGEIENLTFSELNAWTTWAGSRHIEGFNRLYEFTKRKYGILRPGIQVGTFLPAEGLWHRQSPDALLSWKFDLGGVYDYKGDNRLAGYSMIRRYKTLWPERPVLWLSLGIGGYEMNPVRYTQRVPAQPMLNRYDRAYNDTLTAWMAGADTGWFSTWMFVEPDFRRTGMSRMRGVHVWVEDLGPDTRLLDRGIDFSFRGVEDRMYNDQLPDAPSAPEVSGDLLDDTGPDLLDLLESRDTEAEIRAGIRGEIDRQKQAFRNGFLFYQRYIYDCARIFGSLPRANPKPRALVVRHGVTVWTRPRRPFSFIPAESLLWEFDFLTDINMVPNIDLDQYRLLVIHEPEALRDSTIERITRWIRDTPGLVVVHLDLTTDPEAKDGTIDDHEGPLLQRWPWAGEIDRLRDEEGQPLAAREQLTSVSIETSSGETQVGELSLVSSWDLRGPNAQAVIRHHDEVIAALWRDSANFKGAVLFDGVRYASREYLDTLRDAINRLASEGIGIELSPPAAIEVYRNNHISAAAGTHYFRNIREEKTLPGLEVMTGEIDPEVGGPRNRRTALVLRDFIGRYVVASDHAVALSDTPFIRAEKEGSDLLLHSSGVIRVATLNADAEILTANGSLLAVPEDPVEWLLFSEEEGMARFEDPDNPGEARYTFIRSHEPVRVRSGSGSGIQ